MGRGRLGLDLQSSLKKRGGVAQRERGSVGPLDRSGGGWASSAPRGREPDCSWWSLDDVRLLTQHSTERARLSRMVAGLCKAVGARGTERRPFKLEGWGEKRGFCRARRLHVLLMRGRWALHVARCTLHVARCRVGGQACQDQKPAKQGSGRLVCLKLSERPGSVCRKGSWSAAHIHTRGLGTGGGCNAAK